MLQPIYQLVCRLHDSPVQLEPEAYVSHQWPEQWAQGVGKSQEMVWLVEDGESVAAMVYLDPALLPQLLQDNPLQRIHPGNMAPLCAVVEGMSHLALLSQRVQQERHTTALELEIQAEVDKFMLLWRLYVTQGVRAEHAAYYVGQCLFEAFLLNDFAQQNHQERYLVANKVAKAFCLQELRPFWQQPARALALCQWFVRRSLADKLRGHV